MAPCECNGTFYIHIIYIFNMINTFSWITTQNRYKKVHDDWQLYILLSYRGMVRFMSWWRHQMETFSTLLAFCARNSSVTGGFPTQRPVTRSFDVFFDLGLNKWLSKQSWGWWFNTLWRHYGVTVLFCCNHNRVEWNLLLYWTALSQNLTVKWLSCFGMLNFK